MSLLPASSIGDESTGFYNGVATQSARFSDTNNKYLQRTDSTTPTSTQKFTFSCWLKNWSINSGDTIFGSDKGTSGGPGDAGWIQFTTNRKLNIYNITSASYNLQWTSTAMYRDTTNWYHFVIRIDTTQASADDRVRLYVNGTQQAGSYSTTVGQNNNISFNNAAGRFRIAGLGYATGYEGDFYLADVHHCDGYSYAPTEFAESKNGVWIAKNASVVYGNTGYRLEFKNSTVGSTSGSASTIGADTSGNAHHFNDYNMGADDSNMPDSPENNFCTLNPLDKSGGTFSEGNLRYDTSTWDMATGTFLLPSGKWYYEVRVDESVSAKAFSVGIIEASRRRLSGNSYYWSASGWNTSDQGYLYGVNVNGTTEYKISAGSAVSLTSHPDIVQNSVIGIFIDLESSTTSIKYNVDGGTPFQLFTGMQDTDYVIGTSNYQVQLTFNFGQDSTFAGQETAGGNTDANGKGDFHSALPASHTDYLALCSSNLPELTISPAQSSNAGDFFNTVLYNANNQTAQSITGVGFKPDWLWFKQRSRSDAHSWYDSSRGIGPILRLTSHTEYSNTNLVTSFDVDGFSLGTDPFAWVNYQSDSMVAWCWKGNGGTPVSNSEGSLTCNVQANTTSGFSIVTWTGDGNASVTLGHGLEKKPELIIYKGRENSFSWPTWFKTFGTTTGSFIDTSNQPGTFARVKSEPTTTVIPNAELNYTNTNGEGSIAYVFHSVEGYSKIGSYTGNGSSDGTFIYLGFRPAWIITKKVSGSGNWYINDSARSPANSTDLFGGNLYADLQNDEGGNGMDMLSNGFKIRNTDSSQNTGGGTYLYMAFAEQPFKFSNAR